MRTRTSSSLSTGFAISSNLRTASGSPYASCTIAFISVERLAVASTVVGEVVGVLSVVVGLVSIMRMSSDEPIRAGYRHAINGRGPFALQSGGPQRIVMKFRHLRSEALRLPLRRRCRGDR